MNVKDYKKTSEKIKKLKGGKKYYVKIRTYKTIKRKKFNFKSQKPSFAKARALTLMKKSNHGLLSYPINYCHYAKINLVIHSAGCA